MAPTASGATSSPSAPGPPRDAVGVLREEHRCPIEGCQAEKGRWCQHTVTKCAKCRAPHFGQASACPKKRAARGDAKEWRSPSPTWRQRGETPPPEEPSTDAQETLSGGMEVEEEYEPASEEAMVEQGP